MDGNSTLDFREMCFAIWHLCTLDHRGLILMLFDIYDEFQNNMIEEEDMERLLGDAYGIESLRRPEILDLLDEVRLRRHLDRFQFEEFVTRAPQVCNDDLAFPFFPLLLKLTYFVGIEANY